MQTGGAPLPATLQREATTMTNTATKTKITKIDTLHPPREITSDTKARRAWLAATCDAVNAQPNRSAKIVGTGSYQTVSVYEVKQVEGRARNRGTCQVCGGAQVVDASGEIVLHGYNRPGWGYIVNRCPGTAHKPLNVEKTLTEACHAEWTRKLAAAVTTVERAAAEEKRARDAWADAGYPSTAGEPRSLRRRDVDDAEKYAAYQADRAAWAAANPIAAAYVNGQKAHEQARTEKWNTENMVKHFAALLASGVHGSPLTVEVVA